MRSGVLRKGTLLAAAVAGGVGVGRSSGVKTQAGGEEGSPLLLAVPETAGVAPEESIGL